MGAPIKNQYESGACWVFATTAALESALLKSTGIGYEFSINNLHKNMLLYSRYGHSAIAEAGLETVVAEFMLSWYGPIPLEYEAFSVCGKISTPVLASDAIHIQDVVWVKPRQNLTDNDHLKRAIMKYGAFATSLSEIHQGDVFNQNTSSLYNHADGFGGTNHAIAIVGWDDNYPAENFVVDPPGNGAWICKNSFGQESYDKGYMYVSYYDTPFGFSDIVAFSIQNTESYTKNYQTDIIGTVILLSESDSYVYKNTYGSIDDDFISAVGTYFLENESYDLEIHVNGVLKHSQSGNAPFCGFHTVKLESGVPVKKGDTLEIVMKKSSLPLVNETLMRFGEGRSIVYEEGGVRDLALENATASLKAYAKPLVNLTAQIAAADVNTVYNGGKYLTVTVRDVYGDAIAGINVTVGLSNGATKTIATDAKGQARFSTDNLAPKTYTATISTPAFANYLKTSQTAKVTVKKAAVKLTVKPKAFKKSAKAKRYSVTLKTNKNKAMKNVRLALKVNKKTYYAKTNRKGVATFKITKLAKKGKFNAAITYNGNSCYAKLTKKAKITVR